MKSEIIDAKKIAIKKQRVVFDANIWIIINGFCGHSPGERLRVYSDAYKALIESENTIVLNDYVLGEFTNRCAKFEYLLAKETDPDIGSFKFFRQQPSFASTMESIRDTCLNLLDDCEFIQVGTTPIDIREVIEGFCSGELDFSDIILAEHCATENIYLMTDDADFLDCGVKIITANRRMIRAAPRS